VRKIILIFAALTLSLASFFDIFSMQIDDSKEDKTLFTVPAKKRHRKRKRREISGTLIALMDNLPKHVPLLGGCFNFTYITHSETQEGLAFFYRFFEQLNDAQGGIVNVPTNIEVSLRLTFRHMLIIEGYKLNDAEFYKHKWAMRVSREAIAHASTVINDIFKKEFLIIYFLLNRKKLLQPQDPFHLEQERSLCTNTGSCHFTVFNIDQTSMRMTASSNLIFFKCKHFFHPICLERAYHTSITEVLPTDVQLCPICPICNTCITTDDDWLYQIQMPQYIHLFNPTPQSQGIE
jgi:hypothetical protein